MKKITLLLYSLLFITSSLFGSKTDYIIYSSQDYDTVYNTYNTCADTVDPYFPTTYPLFSDSATCFNKFITYSSADWEVLSNSSVFLSTLNHCYDLNRDMLSGNWKIDKSVTETKDLTCEFNCIKEDSSCPVVDGVQLVVDLETCECIRPCVEPPAPNPSVFFNLAGRSCNDSVLTVDEKLYVKRVYPNCSDTECFAEGYNDNDQLCPIPKITVYNNTIMANECVDACPSGEERDSGVFPSECKPIDCGTDMYLDTSVTPAICTANPTCSPGEYLNTAFTPPSCETIPKCPWDNSFFNLVSKNCECNDKFVLSGANCVKDTDRDTIPDTEDDDIDGDGEPNSTDTDDDGDGILDVNDPDSQTSSTCQGEDSSTSIFYGTVYPVDSYRYYGLTTLYTCTYLNINILTIDGLHRYISSFSRKDKNKACENIYCYGKELIIDCNYDIVDYKPSAEWHYKLLATTSATCSPYVDNINYKEYRFIKPNDIDCPNTGFCYLLPVSSPDINETNIDNNPDLNSTTADLKPLLKSQNITNDHLDNIENKVDKTNDELKKLNSNQSDMLALQQQIKKRLDDTTLEELQKDMISEQKSTNTKADTSNEHLKSINTNLLANNGHLSNMSANTRNINDNLINMTEKLTDGLFDDLDPFADTNYSDGSENFTSYQTRFSDNLGVTYQTDLFGLSSIVANSTFQPISVTIHGVTLDIISQSMINSIPVSDIRSLFLFMFAIAGFITVFRTV